MDAAHLTITIHQWLFSALLSSIRIFPVFMVLPFLSSGTVTSLFKFPLVLLLGLSFWNAGGETIYQAGAVPWLLLLVKELLIGIIIAVFLCFPFWVMHAVGSYIDNQRGATISSSISPLSGIDTSELANLFNLLSAVIILEAGGLVSMLEAMQQSYLLWPPFSEKLPLLADVLRFCPMLIMHAARIAAPVVTIFLVTEIMLGLLSRYTPQLNAFSVALTLKSLVGFAVLFLYLSPIIPSEILSLQHYFMPIITR